jgi:hypothetical protein
VHWPSFWARYARTLGAIGLLGLASVSSTALAAFATAVARLAQMQVRRPEQEISASFTEAADEDSLAGRR